MSVTVRHLNADSSFLLTFSPYSDQTDCRTGQSHASYSVLIDPWLIGDSVITHPKFALTKHNIPACIDHLSQIDEPDLVIVSQNKPDHCHAETLQQLRPEGKTIFAAEPGAARAIKSWNYFDPARVFGLPKYNPKRKFSLLRFHIPPLARGGDAGEVTVAFVPAKNYVTGLHNGIGITYQAPTAVKTIARVCTIDLPGTTSEHQNPFSPTSLPPLSPAFPSSPVEETRPGTADGSCTPSTTIVRDENVSARSSDSGISFERPVPNDMGRLSPPFSPSSKTHLASFNLTEPSQAYRPPTPPESPILSSTATTIRSPSTSQLPSLASQMSNPTKRNPARPRPISILYTPHGLPLQDLLPYVQGHLLPLSALPLTMLLHSFSRIDNPWYFGGNIMAGSINGVEIARSLMARVWLSAHDEAKEDSGISVKKIKVKGYTADEIRKMLYQDDCSPKYRLLRTTVTHSGPLHSQGEGQQWRLRGWTCDIRDLEVGKSMVVTTQERDLVESAVKSFHRALHMVSNTVDTRC